MTIQDLSGDYTEVDPVSNRIRSITSNSCRVYDFQGLTESYLYRDFGADFFDGDFIHWMEMYVESASSWPNTGCFGVSNTQECLQDDIDVAGGDYIAVRIKRSSPFFQLYVCINGTLISTRNEKNII